MEDYPSNSHSRPKAAKDETQAKKKVEKVVSGHVKRRKKPLSKRFLETFIGTERSGDVGSYILFDVMIPAAKDMVADAVSQGVERTLFGESTSRSRRRSRDSQYGRVTDYSKISTRSERPSLSARARSRHEVDEVVLPTRVEADEVIDNLDELLGKFEIVTVADLYELLGVTATHVDTKWGWTDLRGAGVSRVRDGYVLNLPRAVHLD